MANVLRTKINKHIDIEFLEQERKVLKETCNILKEIYSTLDNCHDDKTCVDYSITTLLSKVSLVDDYDTEDIKILIADYVEFIETLWAEGGYTLHTTKYEEGDS